MKKVLSMLLVFSLVLCSTIAMAETTDNSKDFVLTLVSNPTTGYTWQHVLSEDGLVTIENEFLTSGDIDKIAGIEPTAQPVSGEGGLELFTVKGVKPGELLLAMEYGQAWDGGETDAGMTYALRVNDDLSVVCVGVMVGLGN